MCLLFVVDSRVVVVSLLSVVALLSADFSKTVFDFGFYFSFHAVEMLALI